MTDFAVAQAGILQLHAVYADAIWRRDYDAFGDCFTTDAEWRFAGMMARGRADIVANLKRMNNLLRHCLITARTPILEVGNGVASGRTYVVEHNVLADGTPFMPIGTYFERYVDQGDRWRFTYRFWITHYAGPPDLSGTFYKTPDYGPPPGMPGPDELPEDVTNFGVGKG
jgi:hypothetical protein